MCDILKQLFTTHDIWLVGLLVVEDASCTATEEAEGRAKAGVCQESEAYAGYGAEED